MKITLDKVLNILLVGAVIFLLGRYFYLQPKFGSGESIPEFTAENIDGRTFSLSDLRGQYVLLDFWGSWCAPCRRQNPDLVALYRQFHGQTFSDASGFEIVSVAIERNERSWRAAIRKDDLSWPYHLLDREDGTDEFGGAIATRFGVRSIPTTYLLDASGVIVRVNPSRQEIERLLSKRHP